MDVKNFLIGTLVLIIAGPFVLSLWLQAISIPIGLIEWVGRMLGAW